MKVQLQSVLSKAVVIKGTMDDAVTALRSLVKNGPLAQGVCSALELDGTCPRAMECDEVQRAGPLARSSIFLWFNGKKYQAQKR